MSKEPKNTRVYLCDIDRYDLKQQRADCREYVEANGLPKIGRSFYKPKELDDLVHNLKRDEVALIARLEGLAEYKGKGVGKRFLINVNRVVNNSLYVVDVDTGIRSDNEKEWYLLLESAYNKLIKSRAPLDPEHYRAIGAMPNKEPGLVESWRRKRKARAVDYIAHARVWGNLGIKPAKYAMSQFDDAELRDVSPTTIKRIFGTRTKCEKWLNNYMKEN